MRPLRSTIKNVRIESDKSLSSVFHY